MVMGEATSERIVQVAEAEEAAGARAGSAWRGAIIPPVDSQRRVLLLRGTECNPTLCPSRRCQQGVVALHLLLVLLSCVALSYDTPALDPSSMLAQRLTWANIALLVCFSLEAALKIIVSGFAGGEASYLSDGWNRLDLFILVCSLLALAASNTGASSLVRLLRVLRPLRLVRRVPGMASIFAFFGEVALEVLNVAGVVVFFLLVFAVGGLQVYLTVDFDRPELSFEGARIYGTL